MIYVRQYWCRRPDHPHLQHLRPTQATRTTAASCRTSSPRPCEGEPITVYGDGTQTRSLCYVSDLVAGMLKAMFTPETEGEVFNLGNPEEHTVLEFAHLISRLSHSVVAHRLQDGAAAGQPHLRRPHAPLPQHRQGPARSGLVARRGPLRRHGKDHRLVPRGGLTPRDCRPWLAAAWRRWPACLLALLCRSPRAACLAGIGPAGGAGIGPRCASIWPPSPSRSERSARCSVGGTLGRRR